jgi:ferredoxin
VRLPISFCVIEVTTKTKFLPDNVEADCAPNENLFKLSRRIKVKIQTACNGVGTCGMCRVKIVSGEECLNGRTKAEEKHLGNVYHINKVRLSCQCKFIKDGTVIVEVK